MPVIPGAQKSPLGRVNSSHVGTQLAVPRIMGKEPPRNTVSGLVGRNQAAFSGGLTMSRGKLRMPKGRSHNGRARTR